MIRITAKRAQGFWRGGVFHPPTPVDHADDRFSPRMIEILRAEPMLVVEEIAEEPLIPEESGSEEPGRAASKKKRK
jgi:hypothetical protein